MKLAAVVGLSVVLSVCNLVLLDALELGVVISTIFLTGCEVCVLFIFFSVELLLMDSVVGLVGPSIVNVLGLEGAIELPKKISSGSCGVVGVVVVGTIDVDLTVVVFSFIFGTTGLIFCFFGNGDIEDITFDII